MTLNVFLRRYKCLNLNVVYSRINRPHFPTETYRISAKDVNSKVGSRKICISNVDGRQISSNAFIPTVYNDFFFLFGLEPNEENRLNESLP